MALQDYAENDEEDFYGQGFETQGAVSVWIGLSDSSNDPPDLDVLQDLCGVGYYRLSDQESNCREFHLVPLADVLAGLSYVDSFKDAVLKAATAKGMTKARWIVVQYDFAYDPTRVKRPIHDDPLFLGVFKYAAND